MVIEYFKFIDEPLTGSFDTYNSMCRKLITEMVRIRNKYSLQNQSTFDRLYVPHTIFNILSDISGFHFGGLKSTSDIPDDNLCGKILDMDIYIDLSMKRNQMLFSFDKSKLRNEKLVFLISDEEEISNFDEVILEIDTEFI